MKILITGHRGFIGRNLHRHLDGKHELVGIDKVDGPEYDLRHCLLPDVDLVIHLAAMAGVRASMEVPNEYWVNNVDVSRRIFEHYSRSGTRIIYASSSSAKEWYRNPYATTKKVMEQLAPPMSCGLRFHTVYGTDSRPDMFFRKLISGAATYVTDHYRDFTHISDVLTAVDCVMDNGVVGIIDVGTGTPVSVQLVAAAAGFDLPVRTPTTQVEANRTCANPKELLALGWKPKQDVIAHARRDCIRARDYSAGFIE